MSDYDWLGTDLDRRIEELKKDIAHWKTHPTVDGPDGVDLGICHCYVPGIGCKDMIEVCEEWLVELISKKRFRIND